LEASSVVDIGCDHGLLSIGLAASRIYSRVLGIDVSMQALKNALDNEHCIYKHSSSSHKNCTLEFQLGNGLETVKDSTLDVVCDGMPQG
jgi:tRNA A22 N-methylase